MAVNHRENVFTHESHFNIFLNTKYFLWNILEEEVICWKGQKTLYRFLWIFFSQDRTFWRARNYFCLLYNVCWYYSWLWTRFLRWLRKHFRSSRCLLLPSPSASHHKHQKKAACFTAKWYFLCVCLCTWASVADAHPHLYLLAQRYLLFLCWKKGPERKSNWNSYKLQLTGFILFSYFDYWGFKKTGGSLCLSVFAGWMCKVGYMRLFSVLRISQIVHNKCL